MPQLAALCQCMSQCQPMLCAEQATRAFTFRRGAYPATIYSLAFSAPDVDPPLLCAASGHGTIHIFQLEEVGK